MQIQAFAARLTCCVDAVQSSESGRGCSTHLSQCAARGKPRSHTPKNALLFSTLNTAHSFGASIVQETCAADCPSHISALPPYFVSCRNLDSNTTVAGIAYLGGRASSGHYVPAV